MLNKTVFTSLFLAAAFGVTFAQEVAAKPFNSDAVTYSKKAPWGDLDVSTEAGAQSLLNRIRRAAKLIVGDGALILGDDNVIAAFAAQSAETGFVSYLRETERVDLDADGARAAEAGRWTGRWRDREMGGTYLAVWRKVTGQWVIESELYVTLT